MLHKKVSSLLHALADDTRRAMVERLSTRPAAVSELAAPLSITLSAVGQHLRVLEACGVVRSTKVGRVRTVEFVPGALAPLDEWLQERRDAHQRATDLRPLGTISAADLPSEPELGTLTSPPGRS